MCAFINIGKAAVRSPVAQADKTAFGFGAGIREIHGVSFDHRYGGVSLRAGERLTITTDEFVYAGENGIETMTHHDLGPLVFYAVQTVYLLHGADGAPAGRAIGRMEFTREDGTTDVEELVLGENVCSAEVKAEWAQPAENGFCVAALLNPVPYSDMIYEPGRGNGLKQLSIAIVQTGIVYRVAGITCLLGRQKVHD